MKLKIYKNGFNQFFIKKITGDKEYYLTSVRIDSFSEGGYFYKFEESWRIETKPYYLKNEKLAMDVIQKIIEHEKLKKQEPKLVYETWEI